MRGGGGGGRGGGGGEAGGVAFDAGRLLLRAEAEFGGGEGVPLGHRVLGAVEAVEDQLAEERVAHPAVDRDVVLGVVVDEVHVVAFGSRATSVYLRSSR